MVTMLLFLRMEYVLIHLIPDSLKLTLTLCRPQVAVKPILSVEQIQTQASFT